MRFLSRFLYVIVILSVVAANPLFAQEDLINYEEGMARTFQHY